MDSYRSNISLDGAARMIRGAGRIVLTTHAKPDGDAFGSVVALTAALRNLGKDVCAWFMGPVPASFRRLRGSDLVQEYDQNASVGALDLLVVLDTGAYAQLAPMTRLIESNLDRTLLIDHHLSGDVPAAWRHIDGQAAACCEIIADLLDALGDPRKSDPRKSDPRNAPQPVPWDPTVCEALFVGIASDTGWFRFSNTRPQTHELAARLLRLNVDHAALYERIEQTERPEKLALLQRALSSLRFVEGGRAAIMVVQADDFAQANAVLEETERFVDVPQSVASVQVVVLITEPPAIVEGSEPAPSRRAEDKYPQAVRISFRSKPGPQAINVAQLAQGFGGGGHARAAGAKVAAPLQDVVQRVEDALASVLGSQGSS